MNVASAVRFTQQVSHFIVHRSSFIIRNMRITRCANTFAIVRFDPWTPIPEWLADEPFLSITRTEDELSIVCPERLVPLETSAERGWRALKVEGPIDFALTGVLSSILAPLAAAKISIFAISTYDTDYVLVREHSFDRTCDVLSATGYEIG